MERFLGIFLGRGGVKKIFGKREERMKLEREERLALIKILNNLASNLKKQCRCRPGRMK